MRLPFRDKADPRKSIEAATAAQRAYYEAVAAAEVTTQLAAEVSRRLRVDDFGEQLNAIMTTMKRGTPRES